MTRRRLVVGLGPAVFVGFVYACACACSVDQDVGTTALAPLDASLPADAAVDARSLADVSSPVDAGPDANLVPNAGFEDGILTGNCGTGWDVDGLGTRMTSPTAHQGSASCQVCAMSPGTEVVLHTMRPMPDAGSTLVPSAWLRGVEGPGFDGGPPTAYLSLNGCFPMCTPSNSPRVSPDAAAWALDDGNEQTVLEAGQPMFDFEVHVDNGCVLVDDVAVYSQ